MRRPVFLLLSFLLFLAACTGTQRPAPVTSYGGTLGAGTLGVHTVISGETLWSIAQRYNMGVQDIATLNRLQPPFHLHDGQRLRLPPPMEYRVRQGDTLYEISRVFGTSQTEIARINNLKAPYSLVPGHKLRLPSPAMKMPEAVPVRVVQSAQAVTSAPSAPGDAPARATMSSAYENIPAPVATYPAAPVYQAPQPVEVEPVRKERVTAKTPPRAGSKFVRPVGGRVISSYGPKQGGLHNDGINIAAPRGTPVRAGDNGVVVYAGSELKGSGNLVLVRHADRWMTAYAHLDRMLVKRGETVKRGQSIGTVGTSGAVSEPQLHFEVRRGTEAINPERYLE